MARDRRQIAALVVTAVVVILVATCRYEFPRYRNGSDAMEPTLHAGDLVIVRRGKGVSRGDLVAFHAPNEPKTVLMKRVIAIGGDVVEMKERRVILNGRAIDEPYIRHESQSYPAVNSFLPTKVPPDHYFVLGDNREKSNDSRFFGFVPRALLIGKPIFVVSPQRGIWRP